MTTDTFIQTPVTINASREKTYVANERKISFDSPAETIKIFNKLTLQSTIHNSENDNSNKNVAKSDPKSDILAGTNSSDRKKENITDTDTTKGNFLHKLLTNREIPAII